MSTTAQLIINQAMEDIGAIASGETPNPEESADCLIRLNQLIALWDTEYLNIFCTQRATYALTGSRTTPYQIGPSGSDFVTPRPIAIRAANVKTNAGGYEFGLKMVTVEEYNAIVEKTSIGEPPEVLYYDDDYPNALLYLYPWPSAADSLILSTWEQLTQMASLSATFDFPPGYQEALEWNLAVSIAPMFGRGMPPEVASKAMSSKASIRANNVPPNPGGGQMIQARGAAVPIPPDASNAMNK